MSIQGLMSVPAKDRDVQWLAYSLQEAVQLEWATIPPYLCAYWSIKTGGGVPPLTVEISTTIRSIVVQEMLHMGLACNMLAGIGGTPNIYSDNFTPHYPGELPGQVHQGLVIGLAGLSMGEPHNKQQIRKFMQIELPENPLALARSEGFATIGEFYDALSMAFHEVHPKLSLERQLTNGLMTDLVTIGTVPDAISQIDLIKRQGEGTSSSPFIDGTRKLIAPARQLAHYYRFGEINAEHRIQADPNSPTGWSFSGASFPFPDAKDLYLMAEVPPGGYPESEDFDHEYTRMLKLLHDAWAQGDGQKLTDAVAIMLKELRQAALRVLTAAYPTGSGQGIKGPDFRFLPGLRGVQRVVTAQRPGTTSVPPRSRETLHRNRRIAIREADAGIEMHIDGVPVEVTRVAPGRYYSLILPFKEYPTAETLAKALVDTEGKLWLLGRSGEAGGSGRHSK
jgi:hypothetical protein